MTIIFISLVISYLLVGWGQLLSEIDPNQIDPPAWTYNPRVHKMLFVILGWPIDGFLTALYGKNALMNVILWGPFSLLLWGGYATFVWSCIIVSQRIFDNVFLQIILAAGFFYIGHFIAIPLIRFVVSIIMMVLTFPLAILLRTLGYKGE